MSCCCCIPSALFSGQRHRLSSQLKSVHSPVLKRPFFSPVMFFRSQACHLGPACPSAMAPSTTVLGFLSSMWHPRTSWWPIWWRTPWPRSCCRNLKESSAGRQGPWPPSPSSSTQGREVVAFMGPWDAKPFLTTRPGLFLVPALGLTRLQDWPRHWGLYAASSSMELSDELGSFEGSFLFWSNNFILRMAMIVTT